MTSIENGAHAKFASQLAAAIAAQAEWPAFEAQLDLDEAYAMQHEVTRLHSGPNVGGIKAGVTDPTIQKFLGLDHALLGSLYGSTRHKVGSTIPYLEGRMIETEIALMIDADGRPLAIAPAIEFVRLKFSRPSDMSAPNLVVSNLGTESFIVGEFLPWNEDLEDIPMVLRQEGEIVNETNASLALGGPAPAARWMHREAIARGFEPSEETVFLAGLCGVAVAANKADFTAEYGQLGAISFGFE